MDINNRLTILQDKLVKQKLGALLVTGRENIRYLSGFSGSAGMLLVGRQKAFLFTDGRYTMQAKAEVNNAEISVTSKPLDLLKTRLEQLRVKRLGVEAQHLTLAAYEKLKKILLNTAHIIAHQNLVENLRLAKDTVEVKKIKQAIQIASEAFAYIQEYIQPGISEKALAGKLECALKERGSDTIPFETIVASGDRSAMPHGIASDKLLANGEFVVFDFGASIDGYNADVSRTIVLGEPSAEQNKIYKVVAQAQAKGIKAIKPGLKTAHIDKITRAVIEKAGYGEYFTHSTGHGVGLEVHETPIISKTDKSVLEPGMVFTVEPGIYVPSIGGVRIEDMVLVTATGYQILSKKVGSV